MIPKQDLTEIIEEQIIEAIVQIFAWKEGRYEFVPQEIPVDEELPVSLDTQHVLMDGLRIVDEWSLVEGKLDLNTIYNRVRAPEEGELSGIEEEVFSLVDAESDVSTIINVSDSGDFETSKALISLEEKGIIGRILVKPLERERVSAIKRLERPFFLAMAAVAFVVLIFTIRGSFDAFRAFEGTRTSLKMERLKTSIDVYEAIYGQYPQSLEAVAERKDPWKRLYKYRLTEEGFTLFSAGPDGIEGTKDDVY